MIKNKLFSPKTICSLLAFTLLATAVTGCGKKTASNNNNVGNKAADASELLSEAQKASKDYVYKQTFLDGIIEKGEQVQFLNYIGDRATVATFSDDGKYKCISVNKDGSDVQSFEVPIDGINVLKTCFASDKDGNFYVIADSTIMKYDNSGKELFKKDIDFQINEISWSEKYGLVISADKGVGIFDEQNGFNVIIDAKTAENKIGSDEYTLCQGAKDLFFLYSSSERSNVIKIDLDNKTLGEICAAIEDPIFSFFGGEGYDLYAKNKEAVYGYDCASDKLTKLLDFQDSDLNAFDVRYAAAISGTELFAMSWDAELNCSLCTLTKVKPEDIPDKILLTMGCVQPYYETINEISKFNKENDKYKIKVVDYSDSYGDMTIPEMVQPFNLDIISGKTPDILCFSDIFSPNIENYANKGILLDLSSEFEKGGAFENIDILPNIFEMMKINGKVYSVIPSFGLDTVVVRKKFADGKTTLTLKDCDELIKSKNVDYKDAFGLMSRERFIESSIQYSGNKFIDWENKKCDLKNPEFIEILNYAKNLPEEKEIDDNFETLFSDDRSLFYEAYFTDGSLYSELKHGVFNDDLSFIGFPNNNGENSGMILPLMQFCISSKTSCPEGAFEFIKAMYKHQAENPEYSLPSEKSSFEATIKKATEPPTDNRSKVDPLTQEEAKELSDYILSSKIAYRSDYQLDTIISEETASLFAGQKSAEEVADIIQNRVSTYLNEQ